MGGIPEYATDEQIMELLKAFGELKAFSLVRHPETGKSKVIILIIHLTLF